MFGYKGLCYDSLQVWPCDGLNLRPVTAFVEQTAMQAHFAEMHSPHFIPYADKNAKQ